MSKYYLLHVNCYDQQAVVRDIREFLGSFKTHLSKTPEGYLVGVKPEYSRNFELFLICSDDPVTFREVSSFQF